MTRRRGQHVPPQALAAREQVEAAQIDATVDRVEHYRMLYKKFGQVRSKCIACGEVRPCIKIEARAPLEQPVYAWDEETQSQTRVDYELDGPMVEICRECLHTDIGTLAKFLVEGL